ncbi:MAG: acyl-[Lachnospiraceae bacterium]|nr:acyl-[acyl-carrier-protein] thioesterase [Lachnospiraceae bacterium]
MYTFETRVRYSEVDDKLILTLPALAKYFQDTCIFDSENKAVVNMEYLASRKLAWVLSSWQIVIERLPKLNEAIKIYTVPYEFKSFMGYRNFWMEDADGHCIVKASSIWTLIDFEHMRPCKPDEEILSGYPLGEKLDMDYAPRKITVEGEGKAGQEQVVYRAQIDSNHHLNNSEYITMAYEYLPENIALSQLRVEYKKQAYLGEKICPVVYEQQGKVQVQLNDIEGVPYAIVEFCYE